jgi:hypothetical protein
MVGNMLKDTEVKYSHCLSMRNKINPQLPNSSEGLLWDGLTDTIPPAGLATGHRSVSSNDVTKALTNANWNTSATRSSWYIRSAEAIQGLTTAFSSRVKLYNKSKYETLFLTKIIQAIRRKGELDSILIACVGKNVRGLSGDKGN